MHRPKFLISSLAFVAAVAVALLLRSVTVSTGQGPVLVTVQAGEWFYDPKDITVASASAVSLTLQHVGSAMIPHDIVFELADGRKAASTRIVGGETDVLGFTAPAQVGEYVFYCSVGTHRARGMEGRLIVTGDGSAVPSPVRTETWTSTPAVVATDTRMPPSGKTPTITVTPRAAYMPRLSQSLYQQPTITPPTLSTPPFPVPPSCPEPRLRCRPCPGCTPTSIPGAGTPTVCPMCRPR